MGRPYGVWPVTGGGAEVWGTGPILNHSTLCKSISLIVQEGKILCPSLEQNNDKEQINNQRFWQQIEGDG